MNSVLQRRAELWKQAKKRYAEIAKKYDLVEESEFWGDEEDDGFDDTSP